MFEAAGSTEGAEVIVEGAFEDGDCSGIPVVDDRFPFITARYLSILGVCRVLRVVLTGWRETENRCKSDEFKE